MAQIAQYKVNQFAKDLNLKSKDILDVLESKNIAVKSQASLDPTQFAVLFEALTKSNQITGIEDYLDGKTYIPSAKKVAEPEKKEETPVAEKAPEAKPEVKAPVAEKAPETKPAEAKKPESVPTPEKEKVEKIEKKEEKVEVKPEVKPVPEQKKPAVAHEPTAKKPEVAQRREERTERVTEKTQRPMQDRPVQQNRPPFNQNNQQRDFQRRDNNGTRPQQGTMQPRDNQGQRDAQRGGRFDNPFGTQQRGAQQQRDNNGARPGQRGGFRDKEAERAQRDPKNTFKAQEIVRPQTQKGDAVVSQRGATRIVDTRAGSVDLSKYDERLDNFAPDMSDFRGGNQRVKKQGGMNNKPQMKNKMKQKGSSAPVTKAPTSVTLPDEIMVSELASRLKVTAAEIVKRLMLQGMMVTVNQTVDYDIAALIALDMGIEVTKEVVVTIEERLFEEEEDSEENLLHRAPVVCVMGHVDHGKTSILDAIRKTNVTKGEAGGITQHIGAYRVRINDQDITFLDTPGHEAFTAMRARGAQATDIAVLVVAADDGIMPQTIEAINHAKAAGIDVIVAINKMDKPTANPDMVKQELTKYDLVPEEWGGDVICVPVSALTGYGIEDLLENILLVAEVKDLKANPKRRAKGIVIEAKLDKGRGPVATILVQSGTLHSGDIVIAGTSVGRVRAMTDHNGKTLKEAGPSVPVEIIGLDEVPQSGDEFNGVADERMARTLADQRKAKAKEEVFAANARANLNDLFAQISEGIKELNVIVKADVGGSAEAVKQSLEKISNEEVRVRVIHAAAGGIRENDVMLAAASNAIIVGFNVRPDKAALDSAERQNVEIRTYRVIYDCINEITDAMKGMLAPKFKETLLGHAEVRQTIHVPNVGTIAGSYIQDGKITRQSMIRIVRDGVVIFEDKISSLKRFKDDAKEVAQGYECGIGLDRFNDIKVGDILEAFIMEEIER